MQDRRQNTRKKTYLGGRVVFDHRQSTMDCILKNLGPKGAKLVFAATAPIPDEFDIQVAHMERSFRARIAWRSHDEAGVAFLDQSATTNIVPLDHAIRIRKLEADKARLEARVAELSSAE
jgi:hypothetical protein